MATIRTLSICALAVVIAGLFYQFGLSPRREDAKVEPPLPPEEVRFGNYDLVLESVDGKCRIAFRSGENEGVLPLPIGEPCRFMRPEDEPLQVYREGDKEIFAVVGGHREHSFADSSKPDRPDCGTQLAGVVYGTDNVFRVSQHVVDSGRYCAKMGLDQRDFWLLLNG